MLHITNGDAAGDTLQRAGVPGLVLAWRDILHEGPVPAALPLEALSTVRARFIADSGWGAQHAVVEEFRQRDAMLRRFREHEEVVLWFEHDLYDQLQLFQLLDFFSTRERGPTRVSLVCVGAFPGHTPFHGLGELSPVELPHLYPERVPIDDAVLSLGHAAWTAYRAPEPWALLALLAGDTTALPFLAAAVRRHLEEFPSVERGLSRTDQQLLDAMVAGPQTPDALFGACQDREEAPFMGDLVLWTHVHRLAHAPRPLVGLVSAETFTLPRVDGPPAASFLAQQITPTAHGRAVLAGHADAVRLNGIDRWLGGVHLQGSQAPWRWDARRGTVVSGGTAS